MIDIKNEIVEKIKLYSREKSPVEACFYLAGKDNIISRIFPMTNVDNSPEHFSFEPVEQFKVIKEVRNSSEKIIAVGHSHPASPARMSEEDIKLAHDPEIYYIIYSLANNELKCFKVDLEKKVTEENILLSD